jgi:hypothetical protein
VAARRGITLVKEAFDALHSAVVVGRAHPCAHPDRPFLPLSSPGITEGKDRITDLQLGPLLCYHPEVGGFHDSLSKAAS